LSVVWGGIVHDCNSVYIQSKEPLDNSQAGIDEGSDNSKTRFMPILSSTRVTQAHPLNFTPCSQLNGIQRIWRIWDIIDAVLSSPERQMSSIFWRCHHTVHLCTA